jgi:transketolase
MRNKFSELLYEYAIRDPRIYVVVADISPAGSMAKFRDEFPDRFINVGVAEQAMIGICAGLAKEGAIPFAYTIAAFSVVRPYEFIRDDIALAGLNVNIVGIGGGLIYSTLGPTHHTTDDIGLMTLLPGMKVYSPGDATEVELVMEQRLGTHSNMGPSYIRLGKAGEPNLPVIERNKSRTKEMANLRFLKVQNNSRVLIVSYGVLMNRILEVSELMCETMNLNIDVASMPLVSPVDWQQIEIDIAQYSLVCVVEEHQDVGSIGLQFAANFKSINKSIHRINLGSKFVKNYGSYEQILDSSGLSVSDIANGIAREASRYDNDGRE